MRKTMNPKIAERVVSRFLTASEKVIDKKNTGNYVVELVFDPRDAYALKVQFTGAWAGGDKVEISLESNEWELDEEAEDDMKKWFHSTVRGDHDVSGLLAHAGFDEAGNPRGRSKPVEVDL
jgi:hypothetical protein